MVPESRRPLGRSVLGLVSPKFLSLSGSPHPPRIPGPARDTVGTGVREGLPLPTLPEPPQPGLRIRYLAGAPGPRSPRPREQSGRAAGSSSSCSPGAQQGARTAELSPRAEARHPRGGAEPRAGAGERPTEASEARAPAHCRRPRAPRALGPAAKRVSGPVSRAGLRDARSQRYK
ncbi:hypothetical protein NN561_009074 [Cricetulus griseus]